MSVKSASFWLFRKTQKRSSNKRNQQKKYPKKIQSLLSCFNFGRFFWISSISAFSSLFLATQQRQNDKYIWNCKQRFSHSTFSSTWRCFANAVLRSFWGIFPKLFGLFSFQILLHIVEVKVEMGEFPHSLFNYKELIKSYLFFPHCSFCIWLNFSSFFSSPLFSFVQVLQLSPIS